MRAEKGGMGYRETIGEGREGWVRPYLRRYGGALALAIALSVSAYMFAAGLMFTSGYMISLAAALPLTVLVLHLPSIFVRIFGIGKPLLGYGERLVSHNWVLRMTSQMRRSLYDALEQKSFALRSNESLGQILELLTEDIGHVQDLFLKSVIPLAASWLVGLILVICTGLFSVQLALLFMLMLAVVVVIMPLVSILVNAARIARKDAIKGELYERLTDDIEGLSDWVLSGNIDGYRDNLLEPKAKQRIVDAQLRRYGRRHDLIVQIFFGACIAALTLWACAVFGPTPDGLYPCLSTEIAQALGNIGDENAPAYAPNWIAAFVLCIFPLLEAFAGSSRSALELKERRGALARMNAFSSIGACSQHGKRAAAEDDGRRCLVSEDPEIDLQNASFSYAEDTEEVLRDVSLNIPYGQHVAVLGKSGTGKTTLAAILHGDFALTDGKCSIGGIEPTETAFDAPRTVGIVSQSPYIFNLTLRDNLKLADPAASDSQLVEALRSVGLQERFEKLPRGLDSIIESHGRNLSGGEAQRIAVARVLLAKQPIIVLDEPFVGLDRSTEKALLETILHVLKDRTIITITHHLENIEMFDRVIFMQGPKRTKNAEGIPDPLTASSTIAFFGTPAELAEDERYRRLLDLSDVQQPQALSWR